MKNFHKAESGAVIFTDYAGARSYLRPDQVPEILERLLADLMHFAHDQGVDIESCIEQARLRFDDDTGLSGTHYERCVPFPFAGFR